MDVVKHSGIWLVGRTILGPEGKLAERRERDKLDVLSRSGTDFFLSFYRLVTFEAFFKFGDIHFRWIEAF